MSGPLPFAIGEIISPMGKPDQASIGNDPRKDRR
jgi:hypothetical protein